MRSSFSRAEILNIQNQTSENEKLFFYKNSPLKTISIEGFVRIQNPNCLKNKDLNRGRCRNSVCRTINSLIINTKRGFSINWHTFNFKAAAFTSNLWYTPFLYPDRPLKTGILVNFKVTKTHSKPRTLYTKWTWRISLSLELVSDLIPNTNSWQNKT